jgi:hypothetical protein
LDISTIFLYFFSVCLSYVPDNLNFSSLGGGGGMRSLLKKHKKRIIPRRKPLVSPANADGNDNANGNANDGDNLGLQLEPDGPPIEELAIEFTPAEIRQREAEVVAASEVRESASSCLVF